MRLARWLLAPLLAVLVLTLLGPPPAAAQSRSLSVAPDSVTLYPILRPADARPTAPLTASRFHVDAYTQSLGTTGLSGFFGWKAHLIWGGSGGPPKTRADTIVYHLSYAAGEPMPSAAP